MESNKQPDKAPFYNKLRPWARKLVLTLGGVCALVTLFLLPPYSEWLKSRVIVYYGEFNRQKSKMGIEQRMADRFGGSYTHSKQIADIFGKNGYKTDALVLIPPTDYFKGHGLDYHVPEPIVFYYYTGLKIVWPNSSNAAKANWYVHMKAGKVVADSITNRRSFIDTLTALNKFDISL